MKFETRRTIYRVAIPALAAVSVVSVWAALKLRPDTPDLDRRISVAQTALVQKAEEKKQKLFDVENNLINCAFLAGKSPTLPTAELRERARTQCVRNAANSTATIDLQDTQETDAIKSKLKAARQEKINANLPYVSIGTVFAAISAVLLIILPARYILIYSSGSKRRRREEQLPREEQQAKGADR